MPNNTRPRRENRRVFHDPATGREVWQMTGADGNNVAPYMYAQAMTPDEEYLCFDSDRSSAWLPYRLEVATGEVERLADFENYRHLSLCMRPGSDEVMLAGDKRLWAVNMKTLERRVMVETEDRDDIVKLGGVCMADAKGERIAFSYQDSEERHYIAIAATDGSMFETVFRREEAVQHVLIHPTRPDLISFAVSPDRQNDPNETHERRARAWLLDARTGHARPHLVMPPGYRATHEYWSHDGSRMYFHKKTVGPGPGTQWIPTWINSIGLDDGDEREHFRSDDLYLGHSCATRDGSRIVSDEQRPGGVNPLLDIDAKAGTARVICWPNLLLGDGHCHVHPSLNPSERFVVYTSNVSGRAEVYMAPIDEKGAAAGRA